MRREQRKQEQEQLKAIDIEIIRAAIVLHALLVDRGKIDPESTAKLLTGLIDVLAEAPAGQTKEKV